MSLDRKQVKRFLALLRTEAEKGKDFNLDLPEGFKESFESQKHFKGWVNYHVTWDVDDDDVWKVVKLKRSKVCEWNDVLRETVPVITKAGEIVTPQQFEAMKEAGVDTLLELEAIKQEG